MSATSNLRVVAWNLSYAYGPGSDGSSFHTRPAPEMQGRLDKAADWIGRARPDILLLQEVDFRSRRSGYINQLNSISEQTGLSHLLPIVAWKHPYVPYPHLLSPRDHFGKVRSGGAILSRYPLEREDALRLPKPWELGRFLGSYYLQRYIHTARVKLPGGPLLVTNLHLEAFFPDVRHHELRLLLDYLARHDNRLERPSHIVGGDFNSDEVTRLTPELTSATEKAARATFPSGHPERQLDYLWYTPATLQVASVSTGDTGELSDHLPLVVDFKTRA